MFKKQIPLLFVLFLVSQAVYPNIKLFPGYYIDNQGDSVLCQIDFRDWVKNPKTIQAQVNNAMREFSAGDIKGFGVFGYCDYRSAKVSYHLNPILGISFPEEYSDSVVTEVCFLKVLEKGVYSLYHLVLPKRDYFFMSSPDTAFSEMVYRVKEKNDTLSEDWSYRKLLLGLFLHEGISGKYFTGIDRASYNISDIGSLVRVLNETHTGIKHKNRPTGNFQTSGNFQMDLFIGGARNSFPASFDGDYSTTNRFKPSYSLSGGVNLLYSIPGDFKAFKLGFSIGYNGYSRSKKNTGSNTTTQSVNYYYTTTYSENLSVSNSIVFANLYVLYIINPLGKTKIYLKGGISYNHSISSNTDVNIKDTANIAGIKNGATPFTETAGGSHSMITLRGSYLSPLAGAGIIEGRNKFELAYSPATNIASPGSQSFKIGVMAVYYYFSLFHGNNGVKKL